MSDDHKIQIVEPSEKTALRPREMHPLVSLATKGGQIDTHTMRELMELQREFERDNARREYVEAMTRVKETMPSVIKKNQKVSFGHGKTNYTFATLAHAMRIVQPHLVEHGFQLSWTPSVTDRLVSVDCKLTHVGGHSETATLSAAPDASGSKNPVQAVGSTITYLERYTALCLLGIATDDMDDADQPVDDESVDAARNLKALGVLISEGISRDEAEEHVQRDVKNWTANDLRSLRELIRDRRSMPVEHDQPNDKDRGR